MKLKTTLLPAFVVRALNIQSTSTKTNNSTQPHVQKQRNKPHSPTPPHVAPVRNKHHSASKPAATPSFMDLLGKDFIRIETSKQRVAELQNRFKSNAESLQEEKTKTPSTLTPKQVADQIISAGEAARGKPYFTHEAINQMMLRAKIDSRSGIAAAIVKAAAKARDDKS